jgi:hypothetical protein
MNEVNTLKVNYMINRYSSVLGEKSFPYYATKTINGSGQEWKELSSSINYSSSSRAYAF